jgi:hypothetical protein
MHIQKNMCDRYRMSKIRLTRSPDLAIMGLSTKFECTRKAAGISRRVIGTHLFNNGISRSDHRPIDKCSVGDTL